MEQLINHYESGNKNPIYIDWSGTTWVEGFNPFESRQCPNSENPFDWWFDQTILSENDKKNYYKLTRSNPNIIDHAKHYFNDDGLKIQQTVDKLYIRPKQHILDKIDEIYEREFKGHVVLGVMARGSEYNLHHPMYGQYGIETYLQEIQKVLDKHPEITKIYIVSEETDYVNKISETFPNSYFVPNVFRRTDETDEYINRVHCWINVSTKRENHTKKY